MAASIASPATRMATRTQANNAPLMERTYESYNVWTDSVKALTAQDELNVLKRKSHSWQG